MEISKSQQTSTARSSARLRTPSYLPNARCGRRHCWRWIPIRPASRSAKIVFVVTSSRTLGYLWRGRTARPSPLLGWFREANGFSLSHLSTTLPCLPRILNTGATSSIASPRKWTSSMLRGPSILQHRKLLQTEAENRKSQSKSIPPAEGSRQRRFKQQFSVLESKWVNGRIQSSGVTFP